MNNLLSYMALAYVSQTVARAAQSLVPWKNAAQLAMVREWVSTATGVSLAFAAQMDILGDVGLDVGIEPVGYLVTGVILGHGVHYAMRFVSQGPWARTSRGPRS